MSPTKILCWRIPRLARSILPYIVASRTFNSSEQCEYKEKSYLALKKAGMFSTKLASDIGLLRYKFISEKVFFEYGRPSLLDGLKPTIYDDSNIRLIREHLNDHRSILFGCAYFGNIFFTLLAFKGIVEDLLIVTAGDPQPSVHLFEKAGAISGVRIEVVGLNSVRGVATLIRRLRANGAVATMLDCFYGHQVPLHTQFMGRPAASLGKLYEICERANAVVVPSASILESGSRILRIGSVIDMQVTSASDAENIVNEYYTDLIRRYPAQWMGWANLMDRWSLAEK